MEEALRPKRFTSWLRGFATPVMASARLLTNRILLHSERKSAIFIQEYHPTRKILQHLKQDSKLQVVLAQYSNSPGWGKYLLEQPIPIWGETESFHSEAEELMSNFRERRCARLLMNNGTDISEGAYRIIDERVSKQITEVLRILDGVISYLDHNPTQLEIMIANIGLVQTLVDCVCKSRGVPSFLIINGLLSGSFLDEGKYATTINAYSISIKEHYFRGMDNVVCLGDPRMDDYVQAVQPRSIDRNSPTVTIGTSGHNSIDLNSYLAVEFEFLHDVLRALHIVREQGGCLRIVIKVRANGYREQYQEFVREYFPGLVDEIQGMVPIREALEKTDFFISIYSQTLFEASCLGIPCLYYKKDNEILDPPFDCNSELVTVGNIDDLVRAFTDFQSGHVRYDAFLKRVDQYKTENGWG